MDAKETADIWVKPFSVSFYGHMFGLIARDLDDSFGETVVDAVPGWTVMIHGSWRHCNYSS